MAAADLDLIRIRTLRRSIADRIEADIALLDVLAGDADFEDGGDYEPSIGGDDREHDEAERGIGDADGLSEQGGNPYAYGYDQAMPFVGGCGL